jgi:amino acid adenylation domain-containing protein
LGYWREQLAGLTPLELPTDYARPALSSGRGEWVKVVIGRELTERLEEMSRREGVTLFMALLAGFQILLERYCANGDVLVGTDIANRNRKETETLIGFFVNQLMLRTQIQRRETFLELLARVRETTLNAYAYQDAPFEKVIEELQIKRDLTRSPLFQTKIVLQNAPQDRLQCGEAQIAGFMQQELSANLELTLFLEEKNGKISATAVYAVDLFRQETMEKFLTRYLRLLEQVAERPGIKLEEIELLGMEDKREILEWNKTAFTYRPAFVHELFEEQAARRPQAIAAVHDGAQLSYGQLNQQANRIARYLRESGVGPEVRVGIYLERNLEMMAALLGTMKSGGAYVPLEPGLPLERLNYMIEDAQVEVLITNRKLRAGLPVYWGRLVDLSEEQEQIAGQSGANAGVELASENLAYVIYTSGSTGEPRGVAVSHQGLRNYAQWSAAEYKLGDGRRSLGHSPLSFDLTVTSLLAPLTCGGMVELVVGGLEGLAAAIAGIRQGGALKLTPSHLRALTVLPQSQKAPMAEPGLRSGTSPEILAVVGGEALNWEDVRQLRAQWGRLRIVNEYGPTETVVGCCVFDAAEEDGGVAVPIGRPIHNAQLYVLDQEMQMVPPGAVGELYIGGVQLARGYLNHPDWTAEKFLPNPFASEEGERLYRSGDRARLRWDGGLEYLGRLDDQVKIRGYRIEMGEIEAALQAHGAVEQAAVVVREDREHDKQLMAYVTIKEQAGVEAGQLRLYLAGRLPEYALPRAVIALQEMPLTSNGKVDRKQLADRDLQLGAALEFRSARDTVEMVLKQIWTEVLELENTGITDDFFALGGHSLKAVVLAHRMAFTFKKEIPARLIFDRPTIAAQAEFLRKESGLSVPGTLVPIQRSGMRRPLFCVHPFFGLAHCYHALSSLLGPDQPLYGLQSYGLEEGQTAFTTIEQMAAFYLQAIRAVQPAGPYQLAGWSMGALIAYEMAQQLTAAGETVSFLGLLDGRSRQAEGAEEISQRDLPRYLELAGLDIKIMENLSPDQIRRFGQVIESNQRALQAYRIQIYSGGATLLRTPVAEGQDPSYGWAEFVKGTLRIYEIPGTHHAFLAAPAVALVAQQLQLNMYAPEDRIAAQAGEEGRRKACAANGREAERTRVTLSKAKG